MPPKLKIFALPWGSSPAWQAADRSFDIQIDRYRADGSGIYTGHFIELARNFYL